MLHPGGLSRDDPIDAADARFIVESAGLKRGEVEQAITDVRLPASPEVQDQFRGASERLLNSLWPSGSAVGSA
jgi:hypothetical protein